MDAVEYLKEQKRMCEYEGNEDRRCNECPFYKFDKLNQYEDCTQMANLFPEECVQLVTDWAINHPVPRYPTWNEWLHNLYYNAHSSASCFTEWLNTTIPPSLAKNFNIAPLNIDF